MQNQQKYLTNSFLGVEKFNSSLGLSFSFFCTFMMYLSEKLSKLDFWGMYFLMSQDIFRTFVPRSVVLTYAMQN